MKTGMMRKRMNPLGNRSTLDFMAAAMAHACPYTMQAYTNEPLKMIQKLLLLVLAASATAQTSRSGRSMDGLGVRTARGAPAGSGFAVVLTARGASALSGSPRKGGKETKVVNTMYSVTIAGGLQGSDTAAGKSSNALKGDAVSQARRAAAGRGVQGR
jgi:hypothetical protein